MLRLLCVCRVSHEVANNFLFLNDEEELSMKKLKQFSIERIYRNDRGSILLRTLHLDDCRVSIMRRSKADRSSGDLIESGQIETLHAEQFTEWICKGGSRSML